MPLRRLISLSLLLLVPAAIPAQTADEFFNGGAQLYISNNVPAALDRTEQGLKLFPEDEKLKKLEALLKQQQQSQSQQNQQQQQQQQQQQNNNSSQNQSSQGQQQNQSQNQQNQNQQNQQNQSQPKNKPESPDKTSGSQNASSEPADGQSMSVREANKLLDSQKGDEKVLV